MIRAVLTRAVALGLLGGLAWAVSVFPANTMLLGGALLAYMVLLAWRPQLWLFAVPALLPVFDLAPWTGWFFLDELDLLLLASAAVGYWRLGAAPRTATLPRFFVAAMALLACSFAISAAIALLPLQPLDANSFANYNSPYNSLRIAKGLAWALLLLPLLTRSAGPGLQHLRTCFVPGMLLGLALTALAVIWERATFPGLFNFAVDYRPTAPFSAMHTGGAALDAYLAISFPFVTLWLAGTGQRWRIALALAALLLGVYAGLATFSRDVYLAYGTAGLVLLALTLGHRLRRGTVDLRALGAALALVVLLAWLLVRMFDTSGYRGMLAALGLMLAALVAAAPGERLRPPALFGAAALLSLLVVGALFAITDKGAYLGYAGAALLFGAGLFALLTGSGARRGQGMALAAAAVPALALGTVLVAWHWGGAAAIPGAALVAALAGAMIALNRLLPRPLWRLDRATLTLGALCAIVLGVTIPIAGSYYTGSRFATVSGDVDVRLGHWKEGLDMMSPDWRTTLFGMGLGRYPDTYFWKNTHGETPGSYAFLADSGKPFLRLGTAQYSAGYGEMLRMLQHVDIKPGQRYRIEAELRRKSDQVALSMQVCERWLLYPQNCIPVRLTGAAADGAGGWRRYSGQIDAQALGRSGLTAPPVQFELGAYGPAGFLDVRQLSIVELASGSELLKNASFAHGNDYWFFSSDRNHFPWHLKNFPVNTWFDTGALGVAAMALMLAYLVGTLAARGLHGELHASVALAALCGFLVVGLFDSLFDVPRLTLIFFLVAAGAVLEPVRAASSETRTRTRTRVRVRRSAADDAAAAAAA